MYDLVVVYNIKENTYFETKPTKTHTHCTNRYRGTDFCPDVIEGADIWFENRTI